LAAGESGISTVAMQKVNSPKYLDTAAAGGGGDKGYEKKRGGLVIVIYLSREFLIRRYCGGKRVVEMGVT